MKAFHDILHYFDEKDSHILELFYRLFQKRYEENVVYEMIHHYNHWLKIDEKILEKLENILGLHFYASTIVDDILDATDRRLGLPTAHLVYGNQSTVCVTNFVLGVNFKNVCSLGRLELLDAYIKLNNYLYSGQGLEIFMREYGVCPSENEFTSIITKKIISYFGGAMDMFQVYSENKTDFSKIVWNVSLFEIIYNDFTNLYTDAYFETKGVGEDISTGTFNFVLVHAIQSKPEDKEIYEIVKQKTKNPDVIKHCLALIADRGSFDYVRTYLGQMAKELKLLIDAQGGNVGLEAAINGVVAKLGVKSYII